jgi:cytochrome c-550 PedF
MWNALTPLACVWVQYSKASVLLTKGAFEMSQTFTSSRQGVLTGCAVAVLIGNALFSSGALAHGDVTPQAVDTRELPSLGAPWRAQNPFRKETKAVTVGSSAYNQNCARCHGLEAVSGGVAPDLRKLDNDCVSLKDAAKKAACVAEIDEYYLSVVRRGRVRNGAVYMPPFEGVMSQEGMWAIKAYLETRREKPL